MGIECRVIGEDLRNDSPHCFGRPLSAITSAVLLSNLPPSSLSLPSPVPTVSPTGMSFTFSTKYPPIDLRVSRLREDRRCEFHFGSFSGFLLSFILGLLGFLCENDTCPIRRRIFDSWWFRVFCCVGVWFVSHCFIGCTVFLRV